MVLAQLSEHPASLMWRTLVRVRKVRCPAIAAIRAPAHLMLAADDPDRIGTVGERNADMTLGPQALGFVTALADADPPAGHRGVPCFFNKTRAAACRHRTRQNYAF